MKYSTLMTIRRIAKKLAPKYTFGYFEKEDIEQEAIIIGLECLDRYDSNLGNLSTFLYHHINNRLKNFKRDHYYQPRIKCPLCGGFNLNCPSCLSFEWQMEVKRNLMEPITLEDAPCFTEDTLEQQELFEIIESHLPQDLRQDYLKLKEDITIPYNRKIRLIETLREIVEEHYA